MPNEKKMKRLEALLDTFDSGAVQPDELIKAIDAVIAIIDQNGKTLVDTILKNKKASDDDVASLRQNLAQTKQNLQSTIDGVKNASESNVEAVRAALLKELKRVESLIPELPPETDLSEVFEQFELQRGELARLGVLIVGENIRNALEALPESDDNGVDQRLHISKLAGVDELIAKIKLVGGEQKSFGVRLLKYLADVNIDGITNGQTLVWNTATGKFIPGSAGTGSGVVETIVAGTGISVDSTDPANPIVTATGGGGGITRSVSSIAAPTTAGATAVTDYVYFITNTTLTLPTAVSNTNRYTVKCISGTCVVDGDGAETIDGTANITIQVEDSVDLISNNTEWKVV